MRYTKTLYNTVGIYLCIADLLLKGEICCTLLIKSLQSVVAIDCPPPPLFLSLHGYRNFL